MEKLLLFLMATAPIWLCLLAGAGWLVVDAWRDRRRARMAALEAWQWLEATHGIRSQHIPRHIPQQIARHVARDAGRTDRAGAAAPSSWDEQWWLGVRLSQFGTVLPSLPLTSRPDDLRSTLHTLHEASA
jgi:hypothetical protein